jgi:hypothetical protein
MVHLTGQQLNRRIKMKTLIIYDDSGKIWVQMSGNYTIPVGLNYIEVEIPEGKYPVSVDVSGEEPSIVYGEYPKSETALLKEQVDSLTLALAEMMGV